MARAGDTTWGCSRGQGRQHGETGALAARAGVSARCLRAAASGAAWEEVRGWLCSSGGLQGGGEQCRGSPGDDLCSDEEGTE